jgi:hypothetical protein
MLAKMNTTITVTPMPIPTFRRYSEELQHLYAKRAVLNSLIQSLEEYNRLRVKRLENRDQVTV